MRGPPMPAKAACGRRPLSAAIRWPARRSPEGSAATMPMRSGPSLTSRLPQDAALRLVDEVEDVAHLGALLDHLLQRLARFRQARGAAVQRAVGALQAGDGGGREAAPLQAL